MRCLLRSLAKLRRRHPAVAGDLRLHFVGTSNQPGAKGEGPVTPIAREEGVVDLISETSQRVPYLEALSLLANSDGILIIGSDEPHYTASKIFPSLMSGSPFLSLFHAASSAHAILSQAGGGLAYSFKNTDELDKLEDTLAEGLYTLATKPESLGGPDSSAFAPYTGHAIAGRFASIFDQLFEERKRGMGLGHNRK